MKNERTAEATASQAAIGAARAKQAKLAALQDELAAIDARIVGIESGAEPPAAGAPPELSEAYQRALAAHALGQATDEEVGAAELAWRSAEMEAGERRSQQGPALDRMKHTLAGLNSLRRQVQGAVNAMEAEMPACLLTMYDAEADRISDLYIAAAAEVKALFGQLWVLNRLAAAQPGGRENRYHTSWLACELAIPSFNTKAFSDLGYRNYPGTLVGEAQEHQRGKFLAATAAERARFAEQGVFI